MAPRGDAVHTRVRVVEPFRLDLTVTVLQRLSTNAVEVWSGGRYLRAFDTPRGPVAWIVSQGARSGALTLELRGPAGDPAPWRRRVARALGTDVDLSAFYARARRFPAVAGIARAMRGVKPTRFASLHESFAGVVLFQQVSLASATAIQRRLTTALTRPVDVEGIVLHPFPAAETIARATEAELRSYGLSAAKARALRSACTAIAQGRLVEAELEKLPSPALHERLLALDGVGPWTAALIMLRGFGRIDQFPPGDVAAEKLLREIGSDASGSELLEALGDTRGMLYYHLFLHRLSREGRGPFAPPVTEAAPPTPSPRRRPR